MDKNREKQIKEILTDLYAIDSSFKDYEHELRETILKLLLAKPDVEFDKEFKEQLWIELRARIEELKSEKPARVSRMSDFYSIFTSPKFAYAFSGVMICLLVLAPVLYFANKSGYFLGQPETKLASNISITRTDDNAFGSLSTQEMLVDQEMLSAEGRGGGGGVPIAVPGSEMEAMIMPDYLNYRYVYNGDDLILGEERIEVLRRQKGEQARSGIANLLSSMDFGVFDLSSFKDVQLQTIQLVQDKDFGYSIFIDLLGGTVSINRNYRNWIPGIMESSPSQSLDIPDDARLIAVADSFIREHKIDVVNYGEPTINRYWESQSQSGGVFEEISYMPQEVSITYPLMINGLRVYDQGGNQFGLTVSVDIREMKVAGLYNLTSQNYETSSYEAETDAIKILDIAEKGGIQGGWYFYGDGETVEAELGTPERIYMRFMTYDSFETNELLVPALLFPIAEAPEGKSMFRKNIIVPLAKELLEENNDIPVPRPMPASDSRTEPAVMLEAQTEE